MPLAVLLAGLTGSGKTTVAQALADRGYLRLSVDEEVHRLHGRYGVDYPEHTYFERERPVVEATRGRFVKEIEAGNDVALDHGLWRRAERDAWRQAAREAGGLPVVVYLPADRDELLRRLTERNVREDANALTVTPEALDDFFARFDPPADDEDVIVYTGDLDVLVAALTEARGR
ncbi:AAA family ATPase [Streptomyces sp. Je 1-369]|uniref:AAA family ATPase n=1 Tax=Streptomyces sp. Je 1-369 TaxID=2966192 RepID=UPI0022855712|nr:ATP-binding protein [Streptomyces sp. Je 1-369]WAL96903.1 ATP-binding protein [Streptomyces sp. Je 1-369]